MFFGCLSQLLKNHPTASNTRPTSLQPQTLVCNKLRFGPESCDLCQVHSRAEASGECFRKVSCESRPGPLKAPTFASHGFSIRGSKYPIFEVPGSKNGLFGQKPQILRYCDPVGPVSCEKRLGSWPCDHAVFFSSAACNLTLKRHSALANTQRLHVAVWHIHTRKLPYGNRFQTHVYTTLLHGAFGIVRSCRCLIQFPNAVADSIAA